MKRNVKRWGAWIMALVMLCSLVMVPAGKVEAAAVSVDLNPETGSKTATVDAKGNVELRFDVPSEYNTTDKLKAAGINKLEVTFKVTSYSAAGSDTAGAQAFLGHGESWSSNGSWQNLETGKEITSTLDLSTYLSSSETIYAYGIQFANLSGSLTYEIVSAKLTGPGTWDVENDNISLSYTSQNQYNSYIEYKFTVKNSGSTAVSGNLVVTFDQTREKNWWTEDFPISLSGNTLTVSNVSIEAGASSKSIQVQLKPIGANITSVSFAGKTISAEETKLSDSGSSGGSESSDDYTGSLTYTVPDDCKDDATTTPFAQHGALHVDSNTLQLTDANGNPFQLRGISSHGINWDNNGEYQYEYVSYDSIKKERDILNANAVRMAMYTHEYNGYTSGGNTSKLKYRVDKGVQCATSLGMYAIVDWHILNKNPKDYVQQAKEFFEYVSKRYAENDHVLYEICNEPTGGIWSDIKAYAEQIIPIIRANDPDAIIIVGTPTWSQDVDIAMNDPLKDSDGTLMDNVMYTVHFYANEHRQPYRDKVEKAKKTIPIFCTEFGTCAADGGGANDFNEAKTWLDYLDANCISYFVWSLCEKNETASLIVSGSSAWSNWTAANLSESGKWIKAQYAARKDVNNTVSTDPVAVTGVTLNQATLEMVVGETATLKATLKPLNATEKGLSWKSSNETVATVSDTGVVTAVKAGTATITVTTDDGGYTATCEVTVTKALPTQTVISGSTTISVVSGTTLKDIINDYTVTAKKEDITKEGTLSWKKDGNVLSDGTILTTKSAGSYTLVFTPADADAYTTAELSVTIKVTKKANTSIPSAPTVAGKTDSSVTLSTYVGEQMVEYGIKQGAEYKWQESPTFENLSPYSDYTLAMRYAETDEGEVGEAGASVTTKTYLSEKDTYIVDLSKLEDAEYVEAHNETITYDPTNKTLTLNNNDKAYTLTGDGTDITVVSNGAEIILVNAKVKSITSTANISVKLEGENVVKAGLASDATITIDKNENASDGKLIVDAGKDGAIVADTIVIKGGSIKANGTDSVPALKGTKEIDLIGGDLTVDGKEGVVPIQVPDKEDSKIVLDGCQVTSNVDPTYSKTPVDQQQKPVNLCKVVYKVDGEVIDTKQAKQASTIALPNLPIKKGYHPEGWRRAGGDPASVGKAGEGQKVDGDITFEAVYTKITGTLDVAVQPAQDLTTGYAEDGDGVTVEITNNTNVTVDELTLAIDSDAFMLDDSKLEQLKSGVSRTVKVKLKNGKAAGTYTTQLTVTVSSGEIDSKKATISRTVKNAVVTVTGINVNLDKKAIELADDQSVTVKATATVSPENATNKQVTWTTSDSKIATINPNGVVTVLSEGTVDIIATAADGSNITGKATLIVTKSKTEEKPDPDDSGKDPGQNPGDSGEVDPGKDPSKPAEEKPNGSGGQTGGSGTGATGNTPAQTPAAPSAADEVKATGIQVTADVKKADNMLVAGTMKLAPKKKMQLNVAFLPEGADEEEVTFTSSNPKVAIVDEDGEITAGKNPGKTTITVKTESGLVKSFQIQVMKKAVTKVKLQVKTKNLKVGKTMKVKATLSPNKKLASNIIYWTSSNEDVVTVTQKGVIKGLKKGKAKITAVAADGSGKKATVTIKVK